ncbi:hypothetical protein OIO90_002551 [Microbotryomycetes sp. JL221]|nr:hypothetical protein OIO90_002551 [Microbotryomycetes sp. JL221]
MEIGLSRKPHINREQIVVGATIMFFMVALSPSVTLTFNQFLDASISTSQQDALTPLSLSKILRLHCPAGYTRMKDCPITTEECVVTSPPLPDIYWSFVVQQQLFDLIIGRRQAPSGACDTLPFFVEPALVGPHYVPGNREKLDCVKRIHGQFQEIVAPKFAQLIRHGGKVVQPGKKSSSRDTSRSLLQAMWRSASGPAQEAQAFLSLFNLKTGLQATFRTFLKRCDQYLEQEYERRAHAHEAFWENLRDLCSRAHTQELIGELGGNVAAGSTSHLATQLPKLDAAFNIAKSTLQQAQIVVGAVLFLFETGMAQDFQDKFDPDGVAYNCGFTSREYLPEYPLANLPARPRRPQRKQAANDGQGQQIHEANVGLSLTRLTTRQERRTGVIVNDLRERWGQV